VKAHNLPLQNVLQQRTNEDLVALVFGVAPRTSTCGAKQKGYEKGLNVVEALGRCEKAYQVAVLVQAVKSYHAVTLCQGPEFVEEEADVVGEREEGWFQ